MKKTGQLIFVSQTNENIMDRVQATYVYYLEILSDRRCVFNIDEEIIEASASKPLYIRTPVKSLICLTAGASLNIIYETGDSTSFGDASLRQFIGNGSLPTESKTIVGAINEIYSNPGIGGGGSGSSGSGFRFPNEKTLLKISEDSLIKWNGYETTIVNNNRAISDLRSTDANIQKTISSTQSLGVQNQKNIESIGKALSDTNQAIASSNEAIMATQQNLEGVVSKIEANSNSIKTVETTLVDHTSKLAQLSKENTLIKVEVANNSKELLNKASNARVDELDNRLRVIEQSTSVEDESFGVDPLKMLIDSLVVLRVDIDNNKKDIASLQKLSEQLDTKYSEVISNLNVDLSSKIKGNENLIKENTKRIFELDAIIDAVISDIENVVSQQDTTDSKLSNLNKSMSIVLAGLDKLQREVIDIGATSSKIYEDLTTETGKNSLAIQNLAAEIKRHIAEFDDFKTKIETQISGTTNGLQEQINQMKITDSEIRQELQRTGLESSQNKKEIETIRASQTAISDDVKRNKSDIDEVKLSYETLQESFSKHLIDGEDSHKSIQEDIGAIVEKNEEQDESILKITGEIEQVNSNIVFIGDAVQRLGLDVSNKIDASYKEEVEDKLSAIQIEQSNLKADAEKTSESVAKNTSEIDNLKLRVSLVEQNPGASGPGEPSDSLIASLTEMNVRIDANKGDIAKLTEKTSIAEESLKSKDIELQNAIQSTDSTVEQNTKAIAEINQSLEIKIDGVLDKIDTQNKINEQQYIYLSQIQDGFIAMDASLSTKADKLEVAKLEASLNSKVDETAIVELDKKINTKADASELSVLSGKLANKVEREEVADLATAVNSKVDISELESIRAELKQKAAVSSVNSLKDSKADKSEITRVEELISAKANSVDIDSLTLEVNKKASKQEVATLSSEISSVSNRVENIQTTTEKTSEEVILIKTNVSKNEVDISSLKSKIAILESTPPGGALTPEEAAELTNALNSLSDKIDTTKKDIVDLNENKDKVKVALETAQTERDQLSAKIVSLEGVDSDIKEELFEHTTKLLKVNADIDYLTTEYDKITSKLGELGLKVIDAEENISTLLLDIKEIGVGVEAITGKVSFLENSVSGLSQAIGTVQGEVESMNSLIVANKNTLDYLSTVVSNTSDKVSNIENTITEMSSEIEGVKESIVDLENKISNTGAQGGTGTGSLSDIYESANISNADRITLKPGKILSIDKWNAAVARYTISFPTSLTQPTQMGFSIYIPDNLSNDVSLLYAQGSSAATIYWGTEKIEKLLRGKVYEFIFTYQTGRITGGFVSYVKK